MLFTAALNQDFSFQPAPNGTFLGNFPFGAGPTDLAPNGKFPRNFPFGTRTTVPKFWPLRYTALGT